MDWRAIQVEVVVVTRDLDVKLELAVVAPAATDTARPDAQLPVAHEVLLALGKAIIRLRSIVDVEVCRGQPEGTLVDLHAPRLVRDGFARRRIGNAGWGFVGGEFSNVLVLGSDNPGLH